MGRKIVYDITGKRFGKLTVLCPTEKRSSCGCIVWKCKCDCGNEVYVSTKNLNGGNTKSCGCSRKEMFPDLLTGKTFGYWEVMYLTEKRNASRQRIYHCKCICGTEKDVSGVSLKNGTSQSCGCMCISKGVQKIEQLLKDNNIEYIKEKTFKNCKFLETNRLARFDFYINNKYIIEYDGIQHFKERDNYFHDSLKERKERDNIKNQYCKDNNIPIIRIPYTHLEDICLEDLIPETSQFLLKHGE